MLFVVVLLSVVQIVFNKFPEHCNTPTGTVLGSTYHRYKEDDTQYLRLSAQSSIALKETLCYKLSYDVYQMNSSGWRVKVTKHRLYALELSQVSHWYNYKSTYQFSIPKLNVRCNCDCPGGSRQCTSDVDSCGANKTCSNWYSDGQTTDGCVWVGGGSKTCCSVDINQLFGTYRAVELGTPLFRPRFMLSVYDLVTGDTLQDSHSFVIDPVSGVAQLDDILTLDISHSAFQSGTQSALPSGLYFGPEGGGELNTNVRINKLNEWSYDKLGWMKIIGSPIMRDIQKNFHVKTRNCGDNQFDTGFAASYYNSVPLEAVELSKYYSPNIEDVQRLDNSRQVEVIARTSPRINIRFMTDKYIDVKKMMYLVDPYQFSHFTASVRTDPYSNTVLELVVYNGVGGLSGYVLSTDSAGEETKEDIFVTLSKKRLISAVKLPINSVRVESVCLFNHTSYYCDYTIENMRAPLQRFLAPEGEVPHIVQADNDVLRFATWRRAADITQWFDSKVMWQEVLLIILILLLIVILILLAVTSGRRVTVWRTRRLFVQDLRAEQARRLKICSAIESVHAPTCSQSSDSPHDSLKSLLGQEVVQVHCTPEADDGTEELPLETPELLYVVADQEVDPLARVVAELPVEPERQESGEFTVVEVEI